MARSGIVGIPVKGKISEWIEKTLCIAKAADYSAKTDIMTHIYVEEFPAPYFGRIATGIPNKAFSANAAASFSAPPVVLLILPLNANAVPSNGCGESRGTGGIDATICHREGYANIIYRIMKPEVKFARAINSARMRAGVTVWNNSAENIIGRRVEEVMGETGFYVPVLHLYYNDDLTVA